MNRVCRARGRAPSCGCAPFVRQAGVLLQSVLVEEHGVPRLFGRQGSYCGCAYLINNVNLYEFVVLRSGA